MVMSELHLRSSNQYKYHNTSTTKRIYTYSFSLKPYELQPSGSCNFSVIKKKQLKLTMNTNNNNNLTPTYLNLYLYGLGYNILNIQGGMAGLKYAN